MKEKITHPKDVDNTNWQKSFELIAPTSAYNAESCLLAALWEIKHLDLENAKRDIKTAISFIQTLRSSLPSIKYASIVK